MNMYYNGKKHNNFQGEKSMNLKKIKLLFVTGMLGTTFLATACTGLSLNPQNDGKETFVEDNPNKVDEPKEDNSLGNSEANVEDNSTEDSDKLIIQGKVYSRIEVTGIEDWQSVSNCFYGLDSVFYFDYVDDQGEMISACYTPGTPDKIVLTFNPETGEAISAVYFGTYNDEEDAKLGAEAVNSSLDNFEGDVLGASANGCEISISLNPGSVRFDQGLRTYFLESSHDTEGFTESCDSTFANANSVYTDYKGDNYACDVIQGYKVTWFE